MSKRIKLHQQITELTRQIAELNSDMQQRNDLSVLDIDLLRKHTIDLYEQVNLLRLVMKEQPLAENEVEQPTANSQKPVAEVETEVEVEVESEIEETPEVEEQPKANSQKPIAEVEMETQVELEMEIEETPEVEEQPTANSQKPIAEVEMETQVEVESEIEETPEVEEQPKANSQKPIAPEEEQNDLASKFSNTPISDLKQAISIAKKFELINSLFGGDVQKYALTIHHINNLNTGDDAFAHLHKLKDEHKWDEEDSNFMELANLVRRRFLG